MTAANDAGPPRQRLAALPSLRHWPSTYLLVAASIMVPLVLFGLAAYQDWRAVQQEARIQTAHVRDIFRAHTLRVFETELLIANAIETRIRDMEWRQVGESNDVHSALRQFQADFPEVTGIVLIDATGTIRASSETFPVEPGRSVADAAFFRRLRDGDRGPTFSSRRVSGLAPSDSFNVAVPRTAPDGTFRGAIAIAVSPDYFERLYQSVRSPSGALTLVRDDGAILVRIPALSDVPAVLPQASALLTAMRFAPEGTFVGASPLDRVERLTSFGQIGGFPVFLSYGIGTGDLVQQWRRRLLWEASYFLPATLILALLAVVAARGHRALVDLNASLEARIAERTADLSRALAEKNVLLQEVHHRVKNNMQVINSLVGLQVRTGGAPEDTARRIHAMALVYELIYAAGDFEGLDLAAYARRLSDSLRSFGPQRLRCEVDAVAVLVALDKAVPAALILNEVLMTAVLHAPADADTRIRLTVRPEGDSALVEISGVGDAVRALAEGESFMSRLLGGLVAQVQGQHEIVGEGSATSFRMVFLVGSAKSVRAAA